MDVSVHSIPEILAGDRVKPFRKPVKLLCPNPNFIEALGATFCRFIAGEKETDLRVTEAAIFEHRLSDQTNECSFKMLLSGVMR